MMDAQDDMWIFTSANAKKHSLKPRLVHQSEFRHTWSLIRQQWRELPGQCASAWNGDMADDNEKKE